MLYFKFKIHVASFTQPQLLSLPLNIIRGYFWKTARSRIHIGRIARIYADGRVVVDIDCDSGEIEIKDLWKFLNLDAVSLLQSNYMTPKQFVRKLVDTMYFFNAMYLVEENKRGVSEAKIQFLKQNKDIILRYMSDGDSSKPNMHSVKTFLNDRRLFEVVANNKVKVPINEMKGYGINVEEYLSIDEKIHNKVFSMRTEKIGEFTLTLNKAKTRF